MVTYTPMRHSSLNVQSLAHRGDCSALSFECSCCTALSHRTMCDVNESSLRTMRKQNVKTWVEHRVTHLHPPLLATFAPVSRLGISTFARHAVRELRGTANEVACRRALTWQPSSEAKPWPSHDCIVGRQEPEVILDARIGRLSPCEKPEETIRNLFERSKNGCHEITQLTSRG